MKSEHRHDLQTNELAKLGKNVGGVLQGNLRPILIGACAVVVLVIAGLMVSSQSKTQKERSWTSYYASNNVPEELAKVADDHAGTVAGAWARLKEAEGNLQQGIQVAFTDRPSGVAEISELIQAKEGFEKLLQGKSVPGVVRGRALLGLARYLETNCDGDTTAAIQAYKRFIVEFGDSSQRELAEQRIQALEKDDTKAFYTWFFKQNPKPKEPDKSSEEQVSSPQAKSDEQPDSNSTTDSESKADEKGIPLAHPFENPAEETTPPGSEKPKTDGATKNDSKSSDNAKSSVEPP